MHTKTAHLGRNMQRVAAGNRLDSTDQPPTDRQPTAGVDASDNELVTLESVHLFVEILDHFFSNVCELDLVFNFHKVYLILDELIMAGEVAESSKKVGGGGG
jgi:hypothetical protein